ncbi:MAG TPA: DoxX family protein [Rhizomicrobium sp.]|jgi:putative oxidoreductase
MSFSETIAPFLGRLALGWFYGVGAFNIIINWHQMVEQLSAKHVPMPPLVLILAFALMVMGTFSLVVGYHTRHGAVLLFAMTIVGAVVLHDYWHIADLAQRRAEFEIFSRDIGICGGLLMMMGLGCGPFGWDNRPPPGAKKRR